MSKTLFSLLAACTIGTAGTAGATVIGGAITGGGALSAGNFVKLVTGGGFSVGNDTFQTPNLYAFDEDQNITISSTINVNVGTNPVAGDVVASHYVFFDPRNILSQVGYVDFDAPIYGVATMTANLAASDFLANTSVTYLNPSLRGLEAGDVVSIDPTNGSRLLVDWLAGTPGDYVRVFTQKSPLAEAAVPLPAPVALLGGAVAGLSLLRRRKAR